MENLQIKVENGFWKGISVYQMENTPFETDFVLFWSRIKIILKSNLPLNMLCLYKIYWW